MSCELCGFATGRHAVTRTFADRSREFCCMGCANVYTILRESGQIAEGSDFRDTELYRESLRLGLISSAGEGAGKPQIPADAEMRECVYRVSGMWCPSCGWLIEQALASATGVKAAEVMFTSDLVKVTYFPQYLPPERIIERIQSLGYRASEYSGHAEGDTKERRSLLLRAGLAFFLWMNVMYVSFGIYASFWEVMTEPARRVVSGVLMALTTPAVVYAAWPILRSAWFGARHRTLRMESLLALGILSAFGYSTAQVFLGGRHLYFDTVCAIVTLVLVGKLLERGAKDRTARALSLLYGMMPNKARLLQEGRERFVSVEALEPGTTFVVKAGERIPADGVVGAGGSHVDESVLTGESLPRFRRQGDPVICGSLTTDGVLEIQATRIGTESTLSQIIRSVEAATATRSQIERVVDRTARVFVPVVMAVAAVTVAACLWAGLGTPAAVMRGIAVLVIACPCALGIATPLAIHAAIGACSRKGILVSDSRVLETVGSVDLVVFDKTGTVTTGEVSVVASAFAPAMAHAAAGAAGEPDPLALAAAIEAYSEHPLGRAVTRYVSSRPGTLPPAREICVHRGAGIEGLAAGVRVFVGNRAMVSRAGASIPAELEAEATGWEAQGRTVAFFGSETLVEGALAFGDTVRPEAAATVAELKRRKIRTALLSGDSEATTRWTAAVLGVDEHRAGVLPEMKMDAVAEYRARGHVVAMVGDGINDAPALAAADLGIALGSGTDLAMRAAPVVLLTSDLRRIVDVFDASRRTIRVVHQNLFWAFAYNALGITLAAAGVLNPILAAGAMVLSSVSVIGNSMRLGR